MKNTDKELEYIISASRKFRKEAGIPQIENEIEYYGTILERPDVFAIVKEGKGFIVGLISPAFLEPNKIMVQELAWFVEKEYRNTSVAIKMLKEFEQTAIAEGADIVNMAMLEVLNSDKMDKIYRKLGYKLFETHYIKDV